MQDQWAESMRLLKGRVADRVAWFQRWTWSYFRSPGDLPGQMWGLVFLMFLAGLAWLGFIGLVLLVGTVWAGFPSPPAGWAWGVGLLSASGLFALVGLLGSRLKRTRQ